MPLIVRALLASVVGIAFISRAIADNEGVVNVATKEELEVAVNEGAAHIVLTEHIDARLLTTGCGTATQCTTASQTALQPLASLRSIRVRPQDLGLNPQRVFC